MNDLHLITLLPVIGRPCDTFFVFHTLPDLALHYHTLPYLTLSCPTLLVLTLPYHTLAYLTFTSADTDMDMTLILPDGGCIPPEDKSKAVISYVTILHRTVLCCDVLHCSVQYCTVLYCTVLYCTVQYSTGNSLVRFFIFFVLHVNVMLMSLFLPPSLTRLLTSPLCYLLTDSVQHLKSYQV